MGKILEAWTVFPHGPIEKISNNLWRVEGSLPNMPMKRVMTVAKRSDGGLVLHNAIALEAGLMAEMDALGPVKYILIPNAYHRLDAKIFKQRYPQAKLLCPKGAKTGVEKVVRVDGTYENYSSDPWVLVEKLEGVAEREGFIRVESDDGVTLVFNDILFNMPHLKGISGFILKHITKSSGGFKTTRLARLFIIQHKAALRSHLMQLANIPNLRRIIVSHHEMISQGAKEALKQVSTTL